MNRALLIAALAFAGCSDVTPLPDAGVEVPDSGMTVDCFAPSPADGPRKVVASHPVSNDGGVRDNRFEVFDLSASGELRTTSKFFRMGRAGDFTSPIEFTPDGRIGFAAQDDGKIGVFRFEGDSVVVVHEAFDSGISPGKLFFIAATHKLLTNDFNTTDNGGGLYTFDVACDGTLSNRQLVLAGDVPSAAVLFDDKALVTGRSLGTSATMQDLHLVDMSTKSVLTSTTGFPDRDAIAPSVSVSRDRKLIALPDNGFIIGSRIAFFELNGNTITSRGVLDVTSPIAVAFSPFADVGLVVQSDGADHYRRLTWGSSFTVAPITYVHARPQLPAVPVMIKRGALEGRVLIGELDAIRQLQFERDGSITDVSKTDASGVSLDKSIGVIGVTP